MKMKTKFVILSFCVLVCKETCSFVPSLRPHATTTLRSNDNIVPLPEPNDDKSDNNRLPPAEWRRQVLQQLQKIIDPDLGADIVTLGFVQNLELMDGNIVKFDVELTTPACPVKDKFATDCEKYVKSLDWVNDVSVTMTAQEPKLASQTDVFGMSKVGSVIAVSSCKGGVGKSTTAVNLAFALQQQGASVGILDADIYGPSLPTMVKPEDDIVRFIGRQIAPLQRNGVKLMSFGYVNDGSAIMRGPMVTQLLDQFMSVIQWGSLDYLIIDMPPGTGDIQLTLTQRLNITAAVIVTTPTELSFADVVRGVEMFDSVNVPSVAVVENMAYYEIPKGEESEVNRESLRLAIEEKLTASYGSEFQNGAVNRLADEIVQVVLDQLSITKPQESQKVQIFGNGHKHRLADQYGIEHSFSVPLMERIAANGDEGTPYVLQHPETDQAKIYQQLAGAVVREVAKIKFGTKNARPDVKYVKEEHIIKIETNRDQEDSLYSIIPPAELRRDCRCASCVEELTGRKILIPTNIPDSVYPIRMYPTGNYALSVDWSDGHRSLYPLKQIYALLDTFESPRDSNADTKNLVAQD